MSAATLIEAAERAYRNYPRWRGHWDGWLLGRFVRDRFTTGVTLFERGEVALIHPEPCSEHTDCRIAYSVLRMIDVHVPTRYFEIVPSDG